MRSITTRSKFVFSLSSLIRSITTRSKFVFCLSSLIRSITTGSEFVLSYSSSLNATDGIVIGSFASVSIFHSVSS